MHYAGYILEVKSQGEKAAAKLRLQFATRFSMVAEEGTGSEGYGACGAISVVWIDRYGINTLRFRI